MKTYLLDKIQLSKLTSWTGLISALLGIALASIILVEKLQLAANPNYVTSCSFNPIISCSNIMSSAQASAFWGFPNPILGLIGFSVVASFYFFSFFIKIPRFIAVINLVGTIGALVFCFWLVTQALFVIQAICIYCCGVWVVTSILAWFGVKALLQDTKHEDWQFYTKIGLVLTITVFLFMVFFAFQQYWLSLFA